MYPIAKSIDLQQMYIAIHNLFLILNGWGKLPILYVINSVAKTWTLTGSVWFSINVVLAKGSQRFIQFKCSQTCLVVNYMTAEAGDVKWNADSLIYLFCYQWTSVLQFQVCSYATIAFWQCSNSILFPWWWKCKQREWVCTQSRVSTYSLLGFAHHKYNVKV